jgi:hypothetical protein
MSSVIIAGNTSGTITLDAPAVAGTTTLTLPTANGTVITTGSPQSGSVLQVVNASSIANIQTSSTSFVTTGFSATITPKFSTSKIFAMVSGGGAFASATSGATLYATIYRNSTNLGDSTYGLCRFTNNAGGPYVAPNSMSVLDSPATTSSTTYTCYFKNAGAAATVDFNYSDRGNVSLTLMEIAA